MWKPIETDPPPKDRIIEAWYKEAGISVAVILVMYPWCNELTLHVCLTGMMEPISKFSHWREPSQGPDAKPDTYDTGLDFWIEKRAGIGILCGQHEEGGEWCKPASRYEVALWEKLQGLLNQMGPDGKSNFWG